MKNTNNLKTLILDILFLIYIVIILKMTVFRGNITPFTNGKLNLVPFQDLFQIWNRGYKLRFIYLMGGNIVCFIPFGIYLKLRFPKLKLKEITTLGFLFSLTIEITQYILGTGITELDDLILNTFGTFLGGLSILILNFKKNIPPKS